jgi:NAD(P)-dependent dehydrogenase (short-subunit alcohol dehydrogenase family)
MVNGKLDGKIALVTAAAQGIGRETAKLFAHEGATVWATDVNMDKLSDLSDTPNIKLLRCARMARRCEPRRKPMWFQAGRPGRRVRANGDADNRPRGHPL